MVVLQQLIWPVWHSSSRLSAISSHALTFPCFLALLISILSPIVLSISLLFSSLFQQAASLLGLLRFFILLTSKQEEFTQASPTLAQMGSTSKKPQRGGNFTDEDDKLLVPAYLNISLDAVQGND
ncbi:hypothetical protein RHMOL_Rhmol10G0071000 [Rhododendron molle]|uniref:Uncharacterized protein n=1 Tax=Rhododendron molle TaxID=49168 RepID=A0ACC0LZT9_RHOML|nr:hypothetical protein RHMOL_Rhmol10G0071000 [Rhododendron molle]